MEFVAIQPVIAALLSWVLLSEVPSRLQIAGIALVLFSIYLSIRPTRAGAAEGAIPPRKQKPSVSARGFHRRRHLGPLLGIF